MSGDLISAASPQHLRSIPTGMNPGFMPLRTYTRVNPRQW
jgi:hypothetical protein